MFKELIQKYKSSGIVVQIITWNVIIFLISLLFFYEFKIMAFNIPNYLLFNSEKWFYYIWTIITYAFFHNDPLHLAFNMLFLYLFSNLFFTFFNANQFLRIYFFGVIFSVFIAYLLKLILGLHSFGVIGSSGVVSLLFFAIATFAPHYRINLILFTLEIWILAGVLFLIDITLIYSGNAGNLVHLGGALAGILWGFYMKKGIEISGFIQYFLDIKNIFKKKQPIKKVYSNSKNSNQNTSKTSDQVKVDAILDKISKNGYDSLTNEEKKFLFQFKDK